ncbi:MAG TPA: hypothetical protein H9824_05665 [Candidatus Bacteroides pullicola]|uniref:Uncharacterized protein n=1 Tax=Candidatus Bacteroides pullicola TaxID=2838475 RepID=A0A9D1ZIH6_9BACE|nr:hypothetical protein [Candidatus Bacteroides pullicola]
MMNDISVCSGCIDLIGDELQYCPLRDNCIRHSLFKLHRDGKRLGNVWQVVAAYKDGKCKLQIKDKQ